MEKVQIAVRLITPDPAAVTALNTVKAMRLQMPPLKIHRYDLWEFREDPELLWVGIVIRDYEDSVSGNWTDLLERRGFPVDSVRWGVLWRLGYLKNTDEALARKMALDLAVSRTRTGGLFSNPVSQEVSFWT